MMTLNELERLSKDIADRAALIKVQYKLVMLFIKGKMYFIISFTDEDEKEWATITTSTFSECYVEAIRLLYKLERTHKENENGSKSIHPE